MRTVVTWFPDWPVTAAAREAGCAPNEPVAVIGQGRVLACSSAARAAGVRRELRVREAQARCPELIALPYDPAVDARAFEPVVATIETVAPGVEVIRPGLCAIAARGPSRYFGGEHAFADALHSCLERAGHSCVIGIADGPFAAEQAARAGWETGYGEFPPGESARCLAPLSVAVLERPELVDLLRRLGIRTLGEFAALPRAQVLARFGADGALAHRLASGQEDRPLATRRPPPDLTAAVDLEPPVDRVDQVAFAVRGAADRLVADLAARDLVCLCLRVEVHTEDGRSVERQWRHPRWFTAADVVDRVRWQAQGADLAAGVVRVVLVPDEVGRTGMFAEGLWGDQAPGERVHRGLSRVQSMLGHEAVVTPVLGGGRSPGDRVTLVPWGEQPVAARPTEPPWPGALPVPAPATVMPELVPAVVLDAHGRTVQVGDRGDLSAEPAMLEPDIGPGETPVAVDGWAGPWPVHERWWDPERARRYSRFQVTCVDGHAYLVRYEPGRRSDHGPWWIEARYD
jgi:protein ImuB